MSNNYVWATKYLPGSISSIVEVGSRDGLDAIFLSKHFGSSVIAFEPNPSSFKLCVINVNNSANTNVQMRPEALSDNNGLINFGVVNPETYPNPGASSLFLIDFSNRPKSDPDFLREPIQEQIQVNASRWDSLGLIAPELLAMDCEGAELKVLKGFGSELRKVRYIVIEVSTVAIGNGACTFREVNAFLKSNNFEIIGNNVAESKFKLYIHLVHLALINRLKRPIGKPLRGLSFDLVYAQTDL